MAGLISRLFGGNTRPPETDPLPGVGGYAMPPGPAGQTGFPGSTGSTRTFSAHNTSAAKLPLRGQANTGLIRAELQSTPGTNKGGPTDNTNPLNQTAGGHPLSGAQAVGGHSEIDTTTPYSRAQPQISRDIPGAQNVRNTKAQSYKAVPGQVRSYESAPRADQANLAPGDGGAGLGPVTTQVTGVSRFVFDGGGVETWAVDRRIPYTGRGDGLRGAQLDGNRYYAAGQYDQFVSAQSGKYGVERLRGGKRPVNFTQPAPWTGNYYDTTTQVEQQTAPQAPDAVYVSPVPARPNTAARRAASLWLNPMRQREARRAVSTSSRRSLARCPWACGLLPLSVFGGT